jgi:light-regulated signal transduction histidine kinase (bacteriophytochrome)
MGILIDDLLKFSRLGRQHLSRGDVNVSALVAEVLEELKKDQGDRPLDIRVGPLPNCSGDWSLLRQVYINLLSNAFKFTRGKDPAVIEVGFEEKAGERIYFVRDNGAGFDMKDAQKLFGVFQRLHAQTEFDGTGVGLSIVQRIIQRHGGRIWADAAPGEGATFYFTIPA